MSGRWARVEIETSQPMEFFGRTVSSRPKPTCFEISLDQERGDRIPAFHACRPDAPFALDFAGNVIILDRSRIAWLGTPKTLAADQRTVERLLRLGGLH